MGTTMKPFRRMLAAFCCAVWAHSAPAGGFSAHERAFMEELFATIQMQSFARGVEFCGYLFVDSSGKLRTTRPVQGHAATCGPIWPQSGRAIASWHTHGTYDPDAWNEIPSGRDVETDNLDGVDGWLATPGGRLWHIDGARMVSHLICGRGCLPADPQFVKGSDGVIRDRYTYKELLRKLAGN